MLSCYMLHAFTLLFWNLLFLLLYVFQPASSSNFVLQKPFNNETVRLIKDAVCFFLLYLLYFWKYSACSANLFPSILMGNFSNFILLLLQHTFSYRNRSAIKIFSFLTFQLFQNKITMEVKRKIFKSSSKLIDFQPFLFPHTLSYRHHSNFKRVSRHWSIGHIFSFWKFFTVLK